MGRIRIIKRILILISIVSLIISCGSSRLKHGDQAKKEGKYDEAIRRYEEVITDDPDDEEVPAAKERIAMCYYRIGMKHYRSDNIAEALRNFRISKNYVSYEKIAEIYIKQGDKAFKDKDYKTAMNNYEDADEAIAYGKIQPPDGLKKGKAKTYFMWAEKEYEDKNYDKARELYELLISDYGKDFLENYEEVLHRIFQVTYAEEKYGQAIDSIKKLKENNAEYKFNEEDQKAFKKMLSMYTKDADTAFRGKKYSEAVRILEKASVLPNFDINKQKQLKARIVFEEGKNFIAQGKMEDALKKLEEAKEIDINIGTEIINLSKRYITDAKKDQLKKKYQAAIDKILIAKQLTPDLDEIDTEHLPYAYYKLAYSLYLKKDYGASLKNIKEGYKYTRNHKDLDSLYKKWDLKVNVIKKKTAADLTKIMNYIEDRYKNAIAADLILGVYKKKLVTWQAKIIGMEESGGKAYGKFLCEFKEVKITFYGLPGVKLDAQRFAASVEEYSKKKGEAIIKGRIVSVEELLGMKNLVVEISSVNFIESYE